MFKVAGEEEYQVPQWFAKRVYEEEDMVGGVKDIDGRGGVLDRIIEYLQIREMSVLICSYDLGENFDVLCFTV